MVELNEINPEMARDAAQRLRLPHLGRLLDLPRSETFTVDDTEHHGLDPWVQWVGIHTGVPTVDHQVRRLGQTRKQQRPQIWDLVGAAGLRWGAWGVMNAPRGTDPNCAVFMPDPWSFEEEAYPSKLNRLLALPRYAAKNYLEFDNAEIFRGLAKLIRHFTKPQRWPVLLRSLKQLIAGWRIAGANVHTLTTLVDYIGVLTFVEVRRQQRLDFSVIFLNHIAHLQHQFWRGDGTIDGNMAFGLKLCDAMLGLLEASRAPDEALLVANGMRQDHVPGQEWCVFRQKLPEEMLRRLGIAFTRVEQCMTHDANLLFDTAEAADRAEIILKSCVLDGSLEPVFFVERETPTQIFYQLAIEHHVPDRAIVVSSNGTVPFHQVFELMFTRTGGHVQIGDVYASGIDVPDRLPNHALFGVILDHFGLGGEATAEMSRLQATA